MKELTDNHLLVLLQSGSADAFSTLFYRHHARVYQFALKLNLSGADAEEIVQETFCAVWINRLKIDPEQKFTNYLYGIARNQAHTVLRKKILFLHYLERLEIKSQISDHVADNRLNQKEIQEFFRHYLNRLPPRRREIFCMSRFDELTYREIALKLGISENTVDTQIRQALNFLRKAFDEK